MDIQRKIDKQKYTDSDVPLYPARTLISHVAVKGLQLGSLVGIGGVVPFFAFYRKMPFPAAFRTLVPFSSALGCAASLALLYGKAYSGELDSDDSVDDRAYRIYKNEGQNKVDTYSFIGAMSGILWIFFHVILLHYIS